MTVRELRRSDGPSVAREMQVNFAQELTLQGWDPDHFLTVVDRSFRFPAGWALFLMRLVGRAPVRLFVAEEEGKLVGTTFLFFSKTHGYIAAVMTDPAYRRRGIASSLLQAAEEACRRRRRRWAVLDVLSDNTEARTLYLRRGYRPLRVQRWLLCPLAGRGVRPVPNPSVVRPMEDGDLEPLLATYRDQQPPPVREVLAPERQWVAPPGYLQAVMSATSAAWCSGPPGAPRIYLRATFTTPKQAGNLSAPLIVPGTTAEERTSVLETALGWLASQGASRVVSEVPDYLTEALATLRGAGFQDQWTMDTLLLSV